MLHIEYPKIKSSLYSPCYVEACNEWRSPPPLLNVGGNPGLKKRRSNGEPWRYHVEIDRRGNRTKDLQICENDGQPRYSWNREDYAVSTSMVSTVNRKIMKFGSNVWPKPGVVFQKNNKFFKSYFLLVNHLSCLSKNICEINRWLCWKPNFTLEVLRLCELKLIPAVYCTTDFQYR